MPAPEPLPQPVPFDAVLFDLDGTLVATDRFWVAAAERGGRRAFEELGLTRPLPTAAEWMSLVGLPLQQGFDQLFGDLDSAARERVLACCLEEEFAALRQGGAELLPGAREVLEDLRAQGVRTAIASNCGARYLEAMLEGLGLGALVDAALCLDSPGVATKRDMLAHLLELFGTRSAVMVGDRSTDAEAAHANGLPHVHLERGFAPAGERIAWEARLGGLGELPERLRARATWIEAALSEVGAAPGRTLGVSGGELCGKTLFARDAGRLAAARGQRTRVLAAADYGSGTALMDELLEPRRRGLTVHAEGAGAGPGAGAGAGAIRPEDLVLVEGPGLGALRAGLDGLIRLEVRAATRDRRRAALGRPQGAPEPSGEGGPADLVLAADNPLGPA